MDKPITADEVIETWRNVADKLGYPNPEALDWWREATQLEEKYRAQEAEQEPVAIPDEKAVLEAIYESGLHQYAPKGILITRWKDGIDVDEPSHCLMNFLGKLYTHPQPRKVCGWILSSGRRSYVLYWHPGCLEEEALSETSKGPYCTYCGSAIKWVEDRAR